VEEDLHSAQGLPRWAARTAAGRLPAAGSAAATSSRECPACFELWHAARIDRRPALRFMPAMQCLQRLALAAPRWAAFQAQATTSSASSSAPAATHRSACRRRPTPRSPSAAGVRRPCGRLGPAARPWAAQLRVRPAAGNLRLEGSLGSPLRWLAGLTFQASPCLPSPQQPG
jgi:hypothetical protein